MTEPSKEEVSKGAAEHGLVTCKWNRRPHELDRHNICPCENPYVFVQEEGYATVLSKAGGVTNASPAMRRRSTLNPRRGCRLRFRRGRWILPTHGI